MNEKEIMIALGTYTKFSDGDIIALCPVCGQKAITVSMAKAPSGKVLVKCSGGCSQEEIISVLKEQTL